MKNKIASILFLFVLCFFTNVQAQKPFTEGTIVYKVKLQAADRSAYDGTYTFTIKGNQVKKELRLANNYEDIILINCAAGTVHRLQFIKGTKFAIQMSMADYLKRQSKFTGFRIENEQSNANNIAGFTAYRAMANYKDGSTTDVYYTKEWQPVQTITYERFPDAHFLPLSYTYKNDNGMTLQLTAERVSPVPVENAVFRIPPDYKILSHEEFQQLSR
jgi:hypothetical protein